jgi:hypothetical protein
MNSPSPVCEAAMWINHLYRRPHYVHVIAGSITSRCVCVLDTRHAEETADSAWYGSCVHGGKFNRLDEVKIGVNT